MSLSRSFNLGWGREEVSNEEKSMSKDTETRYNM
jgi:hypothetical protein